MSNILRKGLATSVLMLAAIASFASTWVPKGTHVTLVFDQAFSSRTAKVGDAIPLHVQDDVMVNGKTVLKAGTHVRGLRHPC